MRPIRIALLCTAVMATSRLVLAGECCGEVCCPCCQHVCNLSLDEVMESKYCWQVECKPVCIPQVTFPWQKCCRTPKCARVRYVRRLKMVDYECPQCRCTWTPELRGCCGAGPGDAPPPVMLEEVSEPDPAPGPTASRSPSPTGSPSLTRSPSLIGVIGKLFSR